MTTEQLDQAIAAKESELAELRRQREEAGKSYGQRVAEELVSFSGNDMILFKQQAGAVCPRGFTTPAYHHFECAIPSFWVPLLRQPIAAALDAAREDAINAAVERLRKVYVLPSSANGLLLPLEAAMRAVKDGAK